MKKLSFMKLVICMMTFIVFAAGASAQTNEFAQVKKFTLQNLRPIIENNTVKGYYLYAVEGKGKKKQNNYRLSIMDNDLNVTNNITISRPRSYRLLESSYNGKAFCFLYMDTKKKALEYLIMDESGNELGKYKVNKVSRSELGHIASMTAASEDSYSGGITAVNGVGFVRYGWEKSKGAHATLEMFDNNGQKIWEGRSAETGKVAYESMVPFYSDDKAIVSFVQVREKMLRGTFKSYLIWHDAKTGEIMFVMDTKGAMQKKDAKVKDKGAKANILLPLSVGYDAGKDEYFVCGEYWKSGDNYMKVKSQGFFMNSVSGSGEMKQESYCSWEKEVKKLIPKEGMERNVTIHKVIRTADGKVFAIGEQFKKRFNGWAIPAAIAAGLLQNVGISAYSNVGLAKLVIYDMVIFEFTPDLKINEVHVFKKDKTNVPLPRGMGVYGPTLLGNFVKMWGGFDYEFTTLSEDQQTFSTGYTNFTKKRKNVRGYKAGSINYTTSKVFAEDKIPFAKKARYFKALPSKPGYVTMVEYYRKGKRVGLRTEQVGQ
jgi:hypothetical protein